MLFETAPALARRLPAEYGLELLVLYRQHVLTPESGDTVVAPTFHLQYLDSLGYPRTRPLAIPHDIYFEEACLVRDGMFCAVTHSAGAFGLTLFQITNLP